MTQLGLSEAEFRQALPAVREELARRLPDVITTVTVVALLPVVRERLARYYRGRGASWPTAADLSQTVVAKTLAALFGAWPRGNIGAWVVAIRNNVGRDHARRRAREAKHVRVVPPSLLAERSDPAAGPEVDDGWGDLTVGLSDSDRAILRDCWNGETDADIGARHGLSADEIRRVLGRLRRLLVPPRRPR
ncbi:hypothetical protein FRUB_04884 [Fimbriiglobus ruber]|uniref:Uncharacterized protein n=1 Tax=Fimbriiglobus ruber TaxID=1908690 RepID=A0A225DHR3_9BACT|nr:hypothetical protein FRUB_04884 [Fimbriiglobus ruber]